MHGPRPHHHRSISERVIYIYHLFSVVFSRFGILYGHFMDTAVVRATVVQSLPYLVSPSLPPDKTSAPLINLSM